MRLSQAAWCACLAVLVALARAGGKGGGPSQLNLPEQRAAAERGDAAAQHALAAMLLSGEGGAARDTDEATLWFRKAAKQGHTAAQARLGNLLVATDAAEAVRWLRQAAASGHAEAQSGLGLLLARGRPGVAQDTVEATRWWRKAAEQGDANSQHYLGLMLVAKDPAEAALWLRQAAAQGHAAAKLQLLEIAKALVAEAQAGFASARAAARHLSATRAGAEEGNVDQQYVAVRPTRLGMGRDCGWWWRRCGLRVGGGGALPCGGGCCGGGG